jgi:hypothetical protein
VRLKPAFSLEGEESPDEAAKSFIEFAFLPALVKKKTF